jgi:SAM-dependent methyltransferase
MGGERMAFTDRIGSVQLHLARYVWALKHCVGRRVLDACCGIGYGSDLLAQVALEVLGVDRSPDAITAAQRYSRDNVAFRECRIEDLSVRPLFDTVVCFEALEHLDDMDAGLAKLLSLTMPYGTLLVSLPVHAGENPWHHARDYSVAQWDEFMGKLDLEMIRFYQKPGDEVPSFSNCDIQYRTHSTEAADGYSLYIVKKGLS